MRISDWSSDVCSSDLIAPQPIGNRAVDVAAVENLARIDPRRDEDGAARAAELDRRAPGDIHRHADVAQGAHLFENLIALVEQLRAAGRDRKSTRPNSSHSCADRTPPSA